MIHRAHGGLVNTAKHYNICYYERSLLSAKFIHGPVKKGNPSLLVLDSDAHSPAHQGRGDTAILMHFRAV